MDGSIQIGRRSLKKERTKEGSKTARQTLLVGHGEDAVPPGWRFVEEIFLAAFPIGAGWTVVGPFVQNDLERFLRVLPTPLAVEFAGVFKDADALAYFVSGALHTVSLSTA